MDNLINLPSAKNEKTDMGSELENAKKLLEALDEARHGSIKKLDNAVKNLGRDVTLDKFDGKTVQAFRDVESSLESVLLYMKATSDMVDMLASDLVESFKVLHSMNMGMAKTFTLLDAMIKTTNKTNPTFEKELAEHMQSMQTATAVQSSS